MQRKKAVLIGSGIASIATAIRLQNLNMDVHVFENNDSPGGKLTEIHKKGYRFDCGPSLFTMPQFVEELFAISGKSTEAYFQYIKKENVCTYFFEDGTRFTAHADQEKFARNASQVFDVEASKILEYFKKSKRKYDLTASLFLEKSLHKITTYFSWDTIKAILRVQALDVNKSLDQVNNQAYADPKMVQFFNRFATYNGSSPYLTPGIMSMIPHLEQYYGTYFPKGGMYSITKSLYQLALDLGVTFHFNAKVEQIVVANKSAVGVKVGEKDIPADVIISNMDIVPTYKRLLPDQKAPVNVLQQSRSSSALIFYWGIQKKFPELDLHNIFFSQDYKKEFDCIFNQNTVYSDPTVYINITSKNEENDAPKGCENWFVMINVPGNKGQDWDQIITRSRNQIFKKLSRILKTNIQDVVETEEILDPRTIESKTQSYQGSLYGAASNTKFAAFLRHPNFSKRIKNLYFCGGSVHPGGGIPLCLLSGKIVSELIQKDYHL
ncbi:phytoene desaturase [Aquimarina sp. U1-2]|uniref:1-hydroxycarotenoid 3,4-desaturase CrtD n=1 Tax=Aquimarina sp. U1-2 TaxID=2823141 RepID=UPI001AECB245|nr:1-hydroxycarotenoid 3,4-desaturase CrtD [Aquimarina sp. U1-2]MBP2833139.1 phytoene desaturase [Aquimarina sp. U1-2]